MSKAGTNKFRLDSVDIADMVIRGTGRFSEKQLLSILGNCVKLGYDNEMLVDTVTAQLLQQMASLDAAQLLDLVLHFEAPRLFVDPLKYNGLCLSFILS